jgi:hypothetical protein
MSLSFAREATLNTLPADPQWFELEPNTINSFGTTIAKTSRSPISKARVRRKQVVTDLDSAVEIEADLTLAHLRRLAESFVFARSVGGDAYLTSAATGGGFTVPALSAAQAGRLIYTGGGAKTLIKAHGFTNEENNVLFALSAAPAPGAVLIPVVGTIAEVPAASAMVEVSIAGIRGAPGDLRIDADGNLISTALNFTTTGITTNQVIYIGGDDLAHQFFADVNTGFARVQIVAPNKLTLAKRDFDFVTDDGTANGAGGSPLSIDILFGQFIRNVNTQHPDYLEVSNQFELGSPNLMPGGATGFEYALGNYADAMSIAIPLTGKATITFGFVGTDVLKPSAARALNAANAKVGGQTAAFGTSSDIARLRAQDVDEAGLTTDFKSATFTLTNNVSAEKVLGKLGARYLNIGDFECDVESQLIFTNPDMIERIRCNKTIGYDWVLRNGDGGVAFDLPSGTLSGGGREYPANQSVLLNGAFAAHQEDEYGFTLGLSFFPFLPVQPCD